MQEEHRLIHLSHYAHLITVCLGPNSPILQLQFITHPTPSCYKHEHGVIADLFQVCTSHKLRSKVKVLSFGLLQVVRSFLICVLQVALVCIEYHSLHTHGNNVYKEGTLVHGNTIITGSSTSWVLPLPAPFMTGKVQNWQHSLHT